MCGFAGFVSFRQTRSAEERRAILARMGSALARRGPDDENIYDDGVLSFVFRRLSIIDPEGGRQPIWNESGDLFVAVNGEIYNHQAVRDRLRDSHHFSTRSDSEVLLHLFEEQGVEAFRQLNGMFGAVLWDRKRQRLVLGRDRVGIKPLYWHRMADGILFGSELKALLLHPDCPREMAWSNLAMIGPQQGRKVPTYIEGIDFVEPGSVVSLDGENGVQTERYWDFEAHICHAGDVTADAFVSRYIELIEDSVKQRLMSDVPFGMFLSGGIDSSLIAAIAARHTRELHCFTVAEQTTIAAGDVQEAVSLCDRFGLPLHIAHFDVEQIGASFSLADFEKLILLIESPRFDPEWFFKSELHRFARHRVGGLKVVMLGQGADEFAGGYSNRLGVHWENWQEYLNREVRGALRETRNQNLAVPGRFEPYLQGVTGATSPDYHDQMVNFNYQLQHFNLWHEDRSSSFNGVESRVPFLDHRLLELMASIPDALHPSLFWDKTIVRRALRHFDPNYPEGRPKVPFFATDEISSIDHFARMIALSIYPDLREKYLVESPLFDVAAADQLHARVEASGIMELQSVWQLLELMSVAVFQQLIQQPDEILHLLVEPETGTPPALTVEALQALLDTHLGERGASTEASWSMESEVEIPPGLEVLIPVAEGESENRLILVHQGSILREIRIPRADYWVFRLFEALTAEGSEGRTLRHWQALFGLSEERLISAVTLLCGQGYLIQSQGGGGEGLRPQSGGEEEGLHPQEGGAPGLLRRIFRSG